MSSSKVFRARLNSMADQRDATQILAAMAYVGNNQPLSDCGINNAASALVFRTGGTARLAIAGGFLQRVAANTNFPALTGLSVPASSKVLIAHTIDRGGNLNQFWGPISPVVAGCTFPDLPLENAVLGLVLLENNSASAFTGGTTALDAANIVLTYANSPGSVSPVPFV